MEYKKKLDEEKNKITLQYQFIKDTSSTEKQGKIKELENEINSLKNRCSELKNVKLNSDSYSKVKKNIYFFFRNTKSK